MRRRISERLWIWRSSDEDPYLFRIDLSRFGLGTARIAFSREPETGATALHLDLLPLSLKNRRDVRSPRYWVAGALAMGATALAIRRRRVRERECLWH